MSYVVLARKWRPQSFEDLVGQEHVSTTIGNAIAQNRVAHAFLFTGVRGVGKTTSARILAKALNCANGPTAKPCQVCAQCTEITIGSDVDVQEIDGASYNGVDEVRRLQETLPYRPQRAQPYFYSENEIQALWKAARSRPSIDPLRPWTYHCLFGLLAVTGLRLGEALNLQTGDMDWAEGILTIRGAKFGKSRLVPLHISTCKILVGYAKRRNERFGARAEGHFLVNKNGNRLDKGEVHRAFYILSRPIGLRGADASRSPRLHDFRHRFAVQTLLRWYRNGEDPERRLPILSTYLGHAHVTDTYWYLTGTPEPLGAAAKRLEKRWEAMNAGSR